MIGQRFAVTPSAPTIRGLADRPAIRPLQAAPARDDVRRRPPFTLPALTPSAYRNVRAALMQVSAPVRPVECTRCRDGKSIWDACVGGPGDPACASCMYNGNGKKCQNVGPRPDEGKIP